jgi:hypothetical protein
MTRRVVALQSTVAGQTGPIALVASRLEHAPTQLHPAMVLLVQEIQLNHAEIYVAEQLAEMGNTVLLVYAVQTANTIVMANALAMVELVLSQSPIMRRNLLRIRSNLRRRRLMR